MFKNMRLALPIVLDNMLERNNSMKGLEMFWG